MSEVLRGNSAVFTLSSILQLIQAESATGVLSLDDVGTIGFRLGTAVQASVGDVEGTDGLLECFLTPGSSFSFEVQRKMEGSPLGDLVGLIMEGCRLSDEWERLVYMIGMCPADLTPQSGDLAQLVTCFDGRTTVEDAIKAAGLSRVAMIDPLLELIDEGQFFEVTTPPPPVRERTPEVVDYYTALDRGRVAMRAGDFDAAQVAFEQALNARDGDRIALQNLRRLNQIRTGNDANNSFRFFKRQ